MPQAPQRKMPSSWTRFSSPDQGASVAPTGGRRSDPRRAPPATARPSSPLVPSSDYLLGMDPLLRFLELAAVAAHPDGERLGEDRERGLRLRLRADVEAARARRCGRSRPRRHLPRAAARGGAPGCGASRVRRRRTRRTRAPPSAPARRTCRRASRTTMAVAWSGATRASASSGHSTTISSALGSRSARRELRACVGDDRPPAEELRRRAQRLGRVDGAVDQQAGRRPVDLREHFRRPRARGSGC